MNKERYCPNCGYKLSDLAQYCPNCGIKLPSDKNHDTPSRVSRHTQCKVSTKTVMLILTIILVAIVLVTGIYLSHKASTPQQSKSQSSLTVKDSNLNKSRNAGIVGSFKDSKDKAAITLNADGTGRYVYADFDNPDTNDQLHWKKDSNNSYTITLKDPNVSAPLTGKLSGNTLTLSGDSSWNTESFIKVKGKLDLDQFLTKAHNNHGPSTQSMFSDADYALMAYLSLQGQSASDLANNDNMHWTQDGNHFTINFGAHSTLMVVNQDNVTVTYDTMEGDHMGSGNGHKTYSKEQLANQFKGQKESINKVLSSVN